MKIDTDTTEGTKQANPSERTLKKTTKQAKVAAPSSPVPNARKTTKAEIEAPPAPPPAPEADELRGVVYVMCHEEPSWQPKNGPQEPAMVRPSFFTVVSCTKDVVVAEKVLRSYPVGRGKLRGYGPAAMFGGGMATDGVELRIDREYVHKWDGKPVREQLAQDEDAGRSNEIDEAGARLAQGRPVDLKSIQWFGFTPLAAAQRTKLIEPVVLINEPAFCSRFRSVFARPRSEDDSSDAYMVTTAFMVDQLRLKKPGWRYVTGIIKMVGNERGLHTWCEHDGIAYDGAIGSFFIATVAKYYHDRQVEVVSSLDATDFRRALNAAIRDPSGATVYPERQWRRDLLDPRVSI
jgi:hypothetical protein